MKNSYLHSVRSATISRKFFTFWRDGTPSGLGPKLPRRTDIGIGPLDVECRDIIYVPDGSKVPLIIREDIDESERGHAKGEKSQSTANNTHTRRKLVGHGVEGVETCLEAHRLNRLLGDAYVYGFMDGEALSNKSEKVTVYLQYKVDATLRCCGISPHT
jgi:hypothetical protein